MRVDLRIADAPASANEGDGIVHAGVIDGLAAPLNLFAHFGYAAESVIATRLAQSVLRVLAVGFIAVFSSSHAGVVAESFVQAPTVYCTDTRKHHDGDTFTCVPGSGTDAFVVRVASIDAPETGQAFWRTARTRLRELAAAGSVVHCYKVDRFNRHICRLRTPDGRDAAELMLSEGLVWYPEDYAAEDPPANRDRYRRLQAEARSAKRGLWIEPDPMPPKNCRTRRQSGLTCR